MNSLEKLLLGGAALLAAGCQTGHITQQDLTRVSKDNVVALQQMPGVDYSRAFNAPALSLAEAQKLGAEYMPAVPRKRMTIYEVTSVNGETHVTRYSLDTTGPLNSAVATLKALEFKVPRDSNKNTMVFASADKDFIGSYSQTNQITNDEMELVMTYTRDNEPIGAHVDIVRVDGIHTKSAVRTTFGKDKFLATKDRYNGRVVGITAAEAAGLGLTIGEEAMVIPVFWNGLDVVYSQFEGQAVPRGMRLNTKETNFGVRPQVGAVSAMLQTGDSFILYRFGKNKENLGVIATTGEPENIRVDEAANAVIFTRSENDRNLLALMLAGFLKTAAGGAVYNAISTPTTNTVIRNPPFGGGSSGSFGGSVPGSSGGGSSSGGFGGGP